MKLGIVGLPQSGKQTVFEALTKSTSGPGHRAEPRLSTIPVPDSRVDVLSDLYNPRKTIYAQVEYFIPGISEQNKDKKEASSLTAVRDCDALIQVVRNFGGYGFADPTPIDDVQILTQELILADLVVVEKRLERVEGEKQRGRTLDPKEPVLLAECRELLEAEIPLRTKPHLAADPLLKGFAFLSAKPLLVLFNNEDDVDEAPALDDALSFTEWIIIKGKLEQELSRMSEEDAQAFLEEFNITASATDRVIKKSYELLGLISFFTVGEDEVRAWTIRKNTQAVDAAEVIHSDIKKGFIRAEIVSYDDLMATGSHAEARKKGLVRLEGKTYPVSDGDIINFRFNV